MNRYLVFAYDVKGRGIDISGRTVQQLMDGESAVVEADLSDALHIVKHTRTGVRHDWDAETHEAARIGYFAVSIAGSGVTSEYWVTPWGLRSRCHDKAWSEGRKGAMLFVLDRTGEIISQERIERKGR